MGSDTAHNDKMDALGQAVTAVAHLYLFALLVFGTFFAVTAFVYIGVGLVVHDDVAHDKFSLWNGINMSVMWIGSIFQGIYSLSRAFLTRLQNIASNVVENPVKLVVLTLLFILAFAWRFLYLEFIVLTGPVYQVLSGTFWNNIIMYIIGFGRFLFEAVAPWTWLVFVRLPSTLGFGLVRDLATCSPLILTSFFGNGTMAASSFVNELVNWTQSPTLVEFAVNPPTFVHSTELALTAFSAGQELGACTCGSLGVVTDPFFEAIRVGDPVNDEPSGAFLVVNGFARALVNFVADVTGTFVHLPGLPSSGWLVLDRTFDQAHNVLRGLGRLPDNLLQQYFYNFVGLTLNQLPLVTTADACTGLRRIDCFDTCPTDGTPTDCDMTPGCVFNETTSTCMRCSICTDVTILPPLPKIFECVADYVWLGSPSISSITSVISFVPSLRVLIPTNYVGLAFQTRSPALLQYVLRVLFNFPRFFLFDMRHGFYIDPFLELLVDLFTCGCNIIEWFADVLQFISDEISIEMTQKACGTIGHGDVGDGIGICILAFFSSVLRSFCCFVLYVPNAMQTNVVFLEEAVVGSIIHISNRALVMEKPCMPPADPEFVEYCRVPKNPGYIFDMLAYIHGDERNVSVCGPRVCNLPRCETDADCAFPYISQVAPKCNLDLNRCIVTKEECDALNTTSVTFPVPCIGPAAHSRAHVGECVLEGSAPNCVVTTFEPAFNESCICTDDIFQSAVLGSTEIFTCYGEFVVGVVGPRANPLACAIQQGQAAFADFLAIGFDVVAHFDLIIDAKSEYSIDTDTFVFTVMSFSKCFTAAIADMTEAELTTGSVAGQTLADSLNRAINGAGLLVRTFLETGKLLYDDIIGRTTLEFQTVRKLSSEIITGIFQIVGAAFEFIGALIQAFIDAGSGTIFVELGTTVYNDARIIGNALGGILAIIIECVFGSIAFFFNVFRLLVGDITIGELFHPLQDCLMRIEDLILQALKFVIGEFLCIANQLVCLFFPVKSFSDCVPDGQCEELNLFCKLYTFLCNIAGRISIFETIFQCTDCRIDFLCSLGESICSVTRVVADVFIGIENNFRRLANSTDGDVFIGFLSPIFADIAKVFEDIAGGLLSFGGMAISPHCCFTSRTFGNVSHRVFNTQSSCSNSVFLTEGATVLFENQDHKCYGRTNAPRRACFRVYPDPFTHYCGVMTFMDIDWREFCDPDHPPCVFGPVLEDPFPGTDPSLGFTVSIVDEVLDNPLIASSPIGNICQRTLEPYRGRPWPPYRYIRDKSFINLLAENVCTEWLQLEVADPANVPGLVDMMFEYQFGNQAPHSIPVGHMVSIEDRIRMPIAKGFFWFWYPAIIAIETQGILFKEYFTDQEVLEVSSMGHDEFMQRYVSDTDNEDAIAVEIADVVRPVVGPLLHGFARTLYRHAKHGPSEETKILTENIETLLRIVLPSVRRLHESSVGTRIGHALLSEADQIRLNYVPQLPTTAELQSAMSLLARPQTARAQATRTMLLSHAYNHTEAYAAFQRVILNPIHEKIFGISATPALLTDATAQPLSHAVDCDQNRAPFECCPGQFCLNCSYVDRVIWAVHNSLHDAADYYAHDYPNRFRACFEQGLDTQNYLTFDGAVECPDAICSRPSCSRDVDCHNGTLGMNLRCNPILRRCIPQGDAECALTTGPCFEPDASDPTICYRSECDDGMCAATTNPFPCACTCSDTYVTRTKLIPSLFRRFGSIRFPWSFNFTRILEELTNGTGSVMTIPDDHEFRGSINSELNCADAADHMDCDLLDLLDTVGLASPVQNGLEDARYAFSAASQEISVTQFVRALLDRYVFSDYSNAYYVRLEPDSPTFPVCCSDTCEEPIQGTTLFEGVIVILVAYVVFFRFLRACLLATPIAVLLDPFLDALFVAMAMSYAYGGGLLSYVSPATFAALRLYRLIQRVFRTIAERFTVGRVGVVMLTLAASLLVAILGLFAATPYPVALGRDVYQYSLELVPPCYPLVVPSIVAHDSALATTPCRDATGLFRRNNFVACADLDFGESRLVDSLDVALYYVGQTVPAVIRQLIRLQDIPVLDRLAARAELHTPERHATGQPQLSDCAALLFPSLFQIGFILVLVTVVTGALIVTVGTAFLVSVSAPLYIGLAGGLSFLQQTLELTTANSRRKRA